MKFDNTRIQKLRSAMLVQPSICVERAKLITESYRATEGEAAPIRRAKAFAHLLKHIDVYKRQAPVRAAGEAGGRSS